MAAVRCAARRLGGSLLQRMPAVVAEEGRLLVPSRCMRPRHLSGKVSGEQARGIQKKQDDIWAGFKETLKRVSQRPPEKKLNVLLQRMMLIEQVSKSVVYGALQVVVVYAAAAAVWDWAST
ncbi:uncharacterized protein LOC123421750 [Hordeum vulgare subsp. vulgare]|uniref:Uncharacterized protein n=1 Tax=Hordeum vulgare subsp. vulgare TaxID=112509 RepID=A0A8I6WZ49_HORVV|nr:uncharacterized protein LOC123421750 [Hordeum vulgare subsp. vulgare]